MSTGGPRAGIQTRGRIVELILARWAEAGVPLVEHAAGVEGPLLRPLNGYLHNLLHACD
jgi:hypothetical protein